MAFALPRCKCTIIWAQSLCNKHVFNRGVGFIVSSGQNGLSVAFQYVIIRSSSWAGKFYNRLSIFYVDYKACTKVRNKQKLQEFFRCSICWKASVW